MCFMMCCNVFNSVLVLIEFFFEVDVVFVLNVNICCAYVLYAFVNARFVSYCFMNILLCVDFDIIFRVWKVFILMFVIFCLILLMLIVFVSVCFNRFFRFAAFFIVASVIARGCAIVYLMFELFFLFVFLVFVGFYCVYVFENVLKNVFVVLCLLFLFVFAVFDINCYENIKFLFLFLLNIEFIMCGMLIVLVDWSLMWVFVVLGVDVDGGVVLCVLSVGLFELVKWWIKFIVCVCGCGGVMDVCLFVSIYYLMLFKLCDVGVIVWGEVSVCVRLFLWRRRGDSWRMERSLVVEYWKLLLCW